MAPLRPVLRPQAARVRRVMRRLATQWLPAPVPVPVAGVVEVFSAREITGWIDVPPDLRQVKVGLHVAGRRVMSVNAACTDALNTNGEIRRFRFPLLDLWKYVTQSDRLTVRLEGQRLPIVGRGIYYTPGKDGSKTRQELFTKLEQGWLFASDGRLRLNKNLDHEWQTAVMELYEQTHRVVHEVSGCDVFLAYGSLLGAVRDGGFIGHDFDFDCAYASAYRDGAEVAAELVRIAYALIAAGLVVECRVTVLHVYRPGDHDARIDLFQSFFDEAGVLAFGWGMAGDVDLTVDLWDGVREVPFAGSTARIPRHAETLVAAMYGPNWRIPDAGFTWSGNRRKRATGGRIPDRIGDAVNWDAWYAHIDAGSVTSFATELLEAAELPRDVVDLGCGDGRDSVAFARAGHTVLGLDASRYALRRAGERGAQVGRVDFRCVDFDDCAAVGALLAEHRGEGPTLYYGRFLLHAIRPDTATGMLGVIAEQARAGDMIALEFRALEDEKRPKARRLCYRRFVDPQAIRTELEELGFEVERAEEGDGWASLPNEDPWLGRIVARRPVTAASAG